MSNENLPPLSTEGDAEYNSDNVQILRDADHIRKRPGVYIGDINTGGLHHLVYELVYNSVDEALAGFCHTINVHIYVDGSLSVKDDGRGIPVDIHPQAKKPTLEVVLTTVGAGGKFDKGAYKVSAGLHGMGAKAVTALSAWVEAEVRRDGHTYVQEYERGKATTEVKEIGIANTTGTRIKFMPDPEIFKDLTFSFDTLEERLRELAFLNKGIAFTLTDDRSGKHESFKYDGGLGEFVKHLNRNNDPIHPPIAIEHSVGDVRVEVALQYTREEEERVRCYANNAYNPVGGTHLTGFRTALTRTLTAYGDKMDIFKNVKPNGDDCRTGVTAVVSIQHPEPQFESQNKIRLLNADVEGAVSAAVAEKLSKYLEENPKESKIIMEMVINAAEAREAAAKARKAIRDRKNILSSGGLPGKLFDCTTRKRDESELFLVEGDSAGGSAEAGRDRMYQAVLPLRGKPLNVEKARLENLLNNTEICALISAIGVDIGSNQDYVSVKETLRYNKIIIMTDADVDGQHIRTLLLTFFYRQMPLLVEHGHIHVARPPLYKVTQKKQVRYVSTGEEMQTELMQRGMDGTSLVILPVPETNQERVTLEADRLGSLLKVVAKLEDHLITLEKRGLSLAALLERAQNGLLPYYRVLLSGKENWFFTSAQVDEFRKQEQKKAGKEFLAGNEDQQQNNGTPPAEIFFLQELHEIREINKSIEELKTYGLQASDLVPPVRLAGREPVPRLVLMNGDHSKNLEHLRELIIEVRRIGEKGMTITRFKGLGEMDPEELWETTLDPRVRTLMQIKLDDAFKADEMFRTLMGDKVEPRRDFIHKYALQVKEIDYHGA
ncbi:MAG: DNA gyrase subunit B [Gemmataceae bacterium]|jgi:DNA gyrase subunit B